MNNSFEIEKRLRDIEDALLATAGLVATNDPTCLKDNIPANAREVAAISKMYETSMENIRNRFLAREELRPF